MHGPTIYKVYIDYRHEPIQGCVSPPSQSKRAHSYSTLASHSNALWHIGPVQRTRLIRPISECNSTFAFHATFAAHLTKRSPSPTATRAHLYLGGPFLPSLAPQTITPTHTYSTSAPIRIHRIHAASTLSHMLRKTAKSQLCTCAWTSGVLLVTPALGTGLRCLAGQWVL